MDTSAIKKPIFLIGMPRSGTTALSESISVHEDLGWFSNYYNRLFLFPWVVYLDRISTGETIGWYFRGQKNQRKTLSSSFRRFLPHTDEAFKLWEACCGTKFSREYLVNHIASENEIKRISKHILTVLKGQNKSRFFTKLTGPPRIRYLKSIFPDAFFIHVIRDPRAVVASLLKVPFWVKNGGLEKPWWEKGLPEKYLDEWAKSCYSPSVLASVQWKRIIELTMEEKKDLQPGHFIEIRYEDFITRPHQYLTYIFNRVELSDSASAHKYITSLGELKNMNYKFLTSLQSEEIEAITRVTKQIAGKYGYISQG